MVCTVNPQVVLAPASTPAVTLAPAKTVPKMTVEAYVSKFQVQMINLIGESIFQAEAAEIKRFKETYSSKPIPDGLHLIEFYSPGITEIIQPEILVSQCPVSEDELKKLDEQKKCMFDFMVSKVASDQKRMFLLGLADIEKISDLTKSKILQFFVLKRIAFIFKQVEIKTVSPCVSTL